MRVTTILAALPLALAAPSADPRKIPELGVNEWTSIQSGFVDRVWNGLSSWSWSKAEEIVASYGGDESRTVYQQLKADEQYSKLVMAIEFSNVKDKFDDPSLSFTFFAPNNDALKPPPGFPHPHHGHDDHGHHGHHGHHDHDHHDHDKLVEQLEKNPSLTTVAALLDGDNAAFSMLTGDKEDEMRKEIFRKIVTKILAYHTIPTGEYTAGELAENSTVATALKAEDGSYAGLHRRVKVAKEIVPPAVLLNFYAKITDADQKASNGVFHTINHPLIPPPSLFDISYQVPDAFSTLTQSIYGTESKEFFDYHYDRNASSKGHPKFTGTGLATVFTPTNAAFHALPAGLKLFLFSPFGECTLKKILAYHYIPHTLLLSELLVDQRKHKHEQVEYFAVDDDKSIHKKFDIHPILPNSTLHIEIDQVKVLPIEGAVKTTIKVNGQTTLVVDAQARNGAFHPLGKLLVPPHHHHDDHGVDVAHLDSWENWEDWLPAFGAEAFEW